MSITWTKGPGDLWTGQKGPFVLKITAKGDGRFAWQVFRDAGPNPTATGVATSLPAAKRVTEQLIMRSGIF